MCLCLWKTTQFVDTYEFQLLVAYWATCNFILFTSKPELGIEIDPGMALTLFLSKIGWDKIRTHNLLIVSLGGQFHQHSMGSFCAIIFKLILLAHCVYRTAESWPQFLVLCTGSVQFISVDQIVQHLLHPTLCTAEFVPWDCWLFNLTLVLYTLDCIFAVKTEAT